MAHRTKLFLTGLALLSACTGGTNGTSAPVLASIPQQEVAGGATLTLDLSVYVTDREGGTMTYAVLSGGGSFTDSTYSNVFDTVGFYTVQFRVTDMTGRATDGRFSVRVNTANLAAVRVDNSGLDLLDVDTQKFVTITASSNPPSVATTLPRGEVVYQLDAGGNNELWLFDTFTRHNTRIGGNLPGSVTYRAKTSDGKLVFTAGTGADTDLYLYNPATTLVREISAVPGQVDGNAMVNSSDLVFYERGNGGQGDIYYYDPSLDSSFAVATGATDERLQAVLPNGAAVLSRVGGGGESDLWYFKSGTGLVEIGADLSATIQNQTKTWRGCTSTSMVVFEVTAATSVDLYMWNPATGASRAIATTVGKDDLFVAVTAIDDVVYKTAQSGTDDDLFVYRWSTNASTTIAATTDDEDYVGKLSNGDVIWQRLVTADGALDLFHFHQATGTSTAIATAGTDDYTFKAVLANDKVVYRQDATTPLLRLYDPVGMTSSTVATGNAPEYVADAGGGDFLFRQTVASQLDLFFWDESAVAVVTVSSTAGDDVYGGFSNGKVLFTRVISGAAELFEFNLGTLVETRLTMADSGGLAHDHTVLRTFSAAW
jgi:hypothetical protein